MSLEEQLRDLNEKLEMTQAIKSGSKTSYCFRYTTIYFNSSINHLNNFSLKPDARAQRNRQIRKEIARVRRKINLQERHSISEPSGKASSFKLLAC